MPRRTMEFRVVVASPSDVFEARKAVFEAIRDVDRILEVQGASVRGLGWEEYATPGIGQETQEVINEQLLREYDILVAIFGVKLGTPTSSWPSGTVEEIETAISQTNGAMGQHRVHVYFRDTIDSVSSISIDELKRVAEFREQLGARGVLYRVFKSDEELRREVRINIEKLILRYMRNSEQLEAIPASRSEAVHPATKDPPIVQQTKSSTVVEKGLLDYLEQSEEALKATNTSLECIAETITEIGTQMQEQTAKIEKVSAPSSTTAEKKTVINGFATYLKSRATELKQEAATARHNFEIYTGAVIALAQIEREDGDGEKYKRDLTNFLRVAEGILSSALEARPFIATFRVTVENLPRITIQFNQAKRLLIEAVSECLLLVDQIERSIYEITAKT